MSNRSRTANTDLIILGHKNIGEADKIIFAYTKEFGKKNFIVKGSRKITSKFTGHLETFNICSAQIYFGPNINLITEINTIKNNKQIHLSIPKLNAALQISELTERILYQDQLIPDLFELLKETIHLINNSDKTFLINTSYTLKLLNLLGFSPNFRELNSHINHKYLKFFEYIRKQTFTDILTINLSNDEIIFIQDFLKRLIEFQTDLKLKSLNFSLPVC